MLKQLQLGVKRYFDSSMMYFKKFNLRSYIYPIIIFTQIYLNYRIDYLLLKHTKQLI